MDARVSQWRQAQGAAVAALVAGWSAGAALAQAPIMQPPQVAADEQEALIAATQPAEPPISQRELNSLVADLGSEDPQVRINATIALQDRGGIRLRQLEEVLRRPDLTAEQRRRLLSAAHRRFYAEPRAALGFRSATTEAGPVVIANVIPGFPAAGVLRAGDRITAVNGVRVPSFAAIRPLIVSRDPGDVLELTILREGATLNLAVELGAFATLQDTPLDYQVVAASWELRSRGLRGDEPPPIPSGLPVVLWMPEESTGVLESEIPDVVVGGEARGMRPPMRARHKDASPEQFAMQHEALRMQEERREEFIRQLHAIERQLAEPNLAPERQNLLLQQRGNLVQNILNCDAAIANIQRHLPR
jgi:hypothetical protein